ncbi:4375_t:CDS:2, partial [Dentiscutata heterogama]
TETDILNDLTHDKAWKENVVELKKVAKRILSIHMSRNEQNEGTYISDVIMPLLRATLRNLPNGHICLSTAERLATLEKGEGKLVEYLYLESSRIFCNDTKKDDNETKLWRELLNGISIVNKSLLIQALKQSISHPPRNVHPSLTVSSPRRDKNGLRKIVKPEG